MKLNRNVVATSVAGLTMLSGQVFAALPTDVSSALASAKADGVEAAGIVLGVIIAIAAFKFIRRAL